MHKNQRDVSINIAIHFWIRLLHELGNDTTILAAFTVFSVLLCWIFAIYPFFILSEVANTYISKWYSYTDSMFTHCEGKFGRDCTKRKLNPFPRIFGQYLNCTMEKEKVNVISLSIKSSLMNILSAKTFQNDN